MTTDRFDYQRTCARAALAELDGPVLNVGSNDDPACLKGEHEERVLNCDLFEFDQVLQRPNAVDVVFDCARDTWPFEDGSVALVILGDIVEHLTPDEIDATLAEARRVAQRLCVTCPMDDRDTTSDEQADKFPRGAVHRTVVTEGLLRTAVESAGWTITDFQDRHYYFVEHGWFLSAQ